MLITRNLNNRKNNSRPMHFEINLLLRENEEIQQRLTSNYEKSKELNKIGRL
jgi:hypothetical protein